jgi:hypothetical protein
MENHERDLHPPSSSTNEAGSSPYSDNFWQRLPGYIATLLLMVTTTLWTYWSFGELYYEGWRAAPFPIPLAYLIPGAICWGFSLAALTWPAGGGWIIIGLGGAFTAWRWGEQLESGRLTWEWALSWFPASAMLVIVGVLFLLEARHRRRRLEVGWSPPPNWFLRNLRYLVAFIPPLITAIALSLYWAPTLITRQDDGYRGEILIEGNGVRLVWAPLGPGWNWKQDFGGYPSWDDLALYGVPPIGLDRELDGPKDRNATVEEMRNTGLCRYLSADGLALMDEPQDIWRLPTTDEIARSLAWHGENAGCSWDGEEDRADCEIRPDKETPLWAPDMEPVYYWTADDLDAEEAYYINYQGRVDTQPKRWGNPRHGYRCVREP